MNPRPLLTVRELLLTLGFAAGVGAAGCSSSDPVPCGNAAACAPECGLPCPDAGDDANDAASDAADGAVVEAGGGG
jgi:hypothetical protein